MPSFEQLRTLVVVAQSDSLKQASDKLYKTQPAVSLAIKQLESQLDVTLFNREHYRLVLTEQGQAIYSKACKVIEARDEVLQTAAHFAQGHEAKVRIAIESSFDLKLILPVLEQAQQQFPDTQIALMQHHLSGPIERLGNHDVDLAISPVNEELMTGQQLSYRHIADGAFITVTTAKMVNKFSSLHSVKQLINEYQVVVKDSGSATQGINLGVQAAQRYWYVNDFAAKLSLIESGMGWGRLPECLIMDKLAQGLLLPIELDDFPSRFEVSYHLVKNSNNTHGPVAQYLWHAIADAIPQTECSSDKNTHK